MNPEELRQAIALLDISQVEAAGLCGVGPRTFRSWVLGEARPPWSACILLRLMLADPVNLRRVQLWSTELVEKQPL